MKPAEIPHDCEHELFGLNQVSLSFRKFFVAWKPDEFMICIQIEPWLVESDNVVPFPISLDLKHCQQSPGQISPIDLLCI
jgi:hypothetical protein